jgi:hypothetical protein
MPGDLTDRSWNNRSVLISITLAAPLVVLLVLEVARLAQRDFGFGATALVAAGGYLVLASPLVAWLDARRVVRFGVPGPGYLLMAGFGLTLGIRGLGLVRGPGEQIVMGLGTLCMIGLATVSLRLNSANQ